MDDCTLTTPGSVHTARGAHGTVNPVRTYKPWARLRVSLPVPVAVPVVVVPVGHLSVGYLGGRRCRLGSPSYRPAPICVPTKNYIMYPRKIT